MIFLKIYCFVSIFAGKYLEGTLQEGRSEELMDKMAGEEQHQKADKQVKRSQGKKSFLKSVTKTLSLGLGIRNNVSVYYKVCFIEWKLEK